MMSPVAISNRCAALTTIWRDVEHLKPTQLDGVCQRTHTLPQDNMHDGPMAKALLGSLRQAVSQSASFSDMSAGKDLHSHGPRGGGIDEKFPPNQWCESVRRDCGGKGHTFD